MASIDQNNHDEFTESFEIIDHNELQLEIALKDSTCKDVVNNNAIVMTSTDVLPKTEKLNELVATFKTPIDDDCNNNHSTSENMRYTRDQLIKIKQFDASTTVPNLKREVKNLLFTEKSELENTLNRKTRTDVIAPAFMNMNASTSSRPKQRSMEPGRRSQQGNRRDGALITLRLQSNEEVVLKEAENAWKPQMLTGTFEELPEGEKKTAELLKQFRSILNKLTPENFFTLIEKLKILQIDTVARLDSCISLVFEKAILESGYASSYANLCKEVSDVFIVPLDGSNNDQQKAVFKKRLITQCQKEFNKHRDNELVKNTTARLEAIENEQDPTRKEEMKAEFELENMNLRKRAVGTVHFIGELYKIEMLTSKIMHSCITHLLDPSMCSEETLECLCKLLSTVGKRLEKLDKNKVDLSEFFVMLSKLADKNNPIGISSRIRFMIQDVIELRLNSWTPRRLQRENKPLTMNEIKQQVILENAIKEMDNKDAIRDEKANRGRRTGAVNDDGWSISSYSKPRPVKFESLKLPIANDDIKLGQPSNFTNFQNYQSNRFAGLKEEENSMEQSNRNSSYNGRYSGNSFEGNKNNRNNRNNNRSAGSKSLQGGKNQNYGSNRTQNYENRPHRQSMQFMQQRPNDFPSKSSTLPRKISAPARPMQYSEAFIQERQLINDPDKVFNILKSSLTGYERKEITLEEVIEKLKKFRISKDSIVLLYNWAFDQHDIERMQLTEIICEGVSRNIIMTRDLLDALKETLDLAQDLACDLPLVYSYIGQYVALPLIKRIIGFKDFLEISKPQIECKNGEKILKNTLKTIEQKFSQETLVELYNESNINFESFFELKSNLSLSSFLKENVSYIIIVKKANA